MTGARIVIATVLLVVLGAALVKGAGDSGDKNPIASVDNGAPRGLLALKLFLERRGQAVSVRRRAEDPAPPAGALVLVPPPEAAGVSDAEADELLAHARAGGVVVAVCDDEELRSARLARLLDRAGASCFSADVALGDVAATRTDGVVPSARRTLVVHGLGRVRATANTDALPFVMLGTDAFATSRAVGEGRVLVLGSATPMANDGLALGDNAALWLDLARGRAVVIDERFHRGRGGAVFALANARGLGPLTLLLGIALLVPLSLLSLAPRRGDLPRERDDAGPPAAAQQASALAALLALARSSAGAAPRARPHAPPPSRSPSPPSAAR